MSADRDWTGMSSPDRSVPATGPSAVHGADRAGSVASATKTARMATSARTTFCPCSKRTLPAPTWRCHGGQARFARRHGVAPATMCLNPNECYLKIGAGPTWWIRISACHASRTRRGAARDRDDAASRWIVVPNAFVS